MELYFRDGGDLTDIEVLVQAAADCGLDADDVRKRLATDEDVALISGQAQEAADKGISGVPTYVFAQKYAVSGAQPPEQLARAIRQVSEEVNAPAGGVIAHPAFFCGLLSSLEQVLSSNINKQHNKKSGES